MLKQKEELLTSSARICGLCEILRDVAVKVKPLESRRERIGVLHRDCVVILLTAMRGPGQNFGLCPISGRESGSTIAV